MQAGEGGTIHAWLWLINSIRFVDILVASLAIIMLIPFRPMNRLHPLVHPALVLLMGYNFVNIFTEIGRWSHPLTWRLPCNLAFAVGSFGYGWVVSRISTGKKSKIPFTGRWIVPFTGQSIVTDKDNYVIYAPEDKSAFKHQD